MTQKGKFLVKFNMAFAESDTAFILGNVTNDIEWFIYGDKRIKGIEDFEKELVEMMLERPARLEVDEVITHGNTASVNGIIDMTDNGKPSSYAFCDVYKLSGFKNPKVKEIKSYVLKIK